MRSFHKSWQNKRPGWTRRVKWYQGENDIRLLFEDSERRVSLVYKTAAQAQLAYDAFANGAAILRLIEAAPEQDI